MRTIIIGAALALSAAAAHAQTTPVIDTWQTQPWTATSNPNSYGELTDGLFKIDADYCVPYGSTPTEFNNADVTFTPGPGTGNTMHLWMRAGLHSACGTQAMQGAEVATGAGWEPGRPNDPTMPFGPSNLGPGYYETRMQPSCVQNEISSFFWVQAPNYGSGEIDVEFPNPPGHNFNDVHWTVHPSGQSVDFTLPFNPCQGFHRYGFAWVGNTVDFYVDRVKKYTIVDPGLDPTTTGFVMANVWSGNANWGGSGPPAQDNDTLYQGMGWQLGATVPPPLVRRLSPLGPMH